MKSSPGRAIAAGCIVAAGFLFISAVIAIGLAKANPGGKDFIEYWAAEQALVHGANPYDGTTILRIERSAGFALDRPEFWYGPPPALMLALPLGFVGATTGLIGWTILQFLLLSLSLWMIWRLHGRPDTLLHLCGYLFAPAVLCIGAGQISFLFLLGVTLFLALHESRPFFAGATLLPCILKPHLFLPFAVVLFLWIVARRSYAILLGFFAALLASSLIVLPFNAHAWSQYLRLMRNGDMMGEYIATLSVSLRFVLDRHAAWLQFIPAYIACGWAIWFFWTRRARWNWMDQGLLVLLVSVMCAPYGWFFDESVLLPAVLTGVWRAKTSNRPLWPIALIGVVALIEVFRSVNVMSPFYLWSTPAWLGWYLFATRGSATALNDAHHAQEIGSVNELPKAVSGEGAPSA